jgi:hypothetical protein
LKAAFLDAVTTALPRFPAPADSPEAAGEGEAEDRTVWARARANLQGLRTTQSIEDGALGERIDWAARGPIERFAARWFTERERAVAEFLLGENVGWWSVRWRQSAIVAALVTVGAFGGFLPPLLVLFGGVLSMLIGCPALGGYWIAFSPVRTGGLNIPLIALFPVGYREASGVIVKSGALRIAAWLPLGLLIGVAIGFVIQNPEEGLAPETGIAIMLYLVYVVLAFQPMAAAVRFDTGVNGSRRGRYFPVTMGIGAAFVFNAFILFPLALSDAEGFRLGFALFLPILSLSFWRWYAFLMHRGRIDQLTAPRR